MQSLLDPAILFKGPEQVRQLLAPKAVQVRQVGWQI